MPQASPSPPALRGGRGRALAALALVVLTTLVTSGCLSFQAAHIPDKFLEGPGGNGWERSENRSMSEPASEWMGFKKSQTLTYVDNAEDGVGFPGSLTLITLRAATTFDREELKDLIQEQVRSKAEAAGLAVEDTPVEGSRALASGAESTYFVYEGSVSETGFFTERNAEARIIGEVWNCVEAKTSVIAVGFAQVASTSRTGGLQLPGGSRGSDPTTWRELVEDPDGTIGSLKGGRGLLYNTAC